MQTELIAIVLVKRTAFFTRHLHYTEDGLLLCDNIINR